MKIFLHKAKIVTVPIQEELKVFGLLWMVILLYLYRKTKGLLATPVLVLLFIALVPNKTFAAFSVTGIAVSSQSTALTYGTGSSTTYTLTLTESGGGGGSSTLSINWTAPAGTSVTGLGSIALTGNGQTVNFTITSSGTTPAATTAFTIFSTNGGVSSPSANFVVDKKALTITGITANNKTYNGLTTTTLSGTAAYSGLQNGESFSVTGSPLASFATANVGTGKAVSVSGYTAPSSNYTVTQPTGLTADITKASLTITANNGTKIYGSTQSTPITGATTFGATGLQNGETIGSVTLTYGTGALANNDAVGSTSTITPSSAVGGTFNASNYTISYTSNSGTLTVTARPLTITANNGTKIYGSTQSTPITGATTFSATGLQNGETIGSVTLTYGVGALTATAAVGSTSTITPSVATGGTFNASNYSISYTSNSGTLTVTAKPLTITADNGTKVCGSTQSTPITGVTTFSSTGLQNGETIGSVTLTYGAGALAANDAVGSTSTITPSSAVGGTFTASNYSISYASGILTVIAAPTVGTPTAITISAGTEPSCQLTNGTTTTTYTTTATNSIGFNWSLSNGLAGSIGATTGVMTWANGFSGSVDIQVTANGSCNGPSSQVVRTITVTSTANVGTVTAGTSPQCIGATTTYTVASQVLGGGTGGWTSSNTAVATVVAGTGVVTAVGAGTCNIVYTVTGGCGGTVSTSQSYTVNATASAGTVTAGTSPQCIGATTTYTVASQVLGGGTGGWTSSNTAVATVVAGTGVVTAVGAGTCNIVYTVTGGCGGTVSASQSYTVTPNNTVSTASSTPTLCGNTGLTAITHTTTGATGIGGATGLPTGVTATWVSNTITISGTPSVAGGTFNYSIPLTGGCGSVNATGTITVLSNMTVTATSNSVVCAGTTLNLFGNVTSGAVGTPTYYWTGPLGFSSTLQNPSITNVPMGAAGIYTLTVTNGNGCTTTQTTTVIVNPVPNVSINPTFVSGFVKKATGQAVLYTYTITNIGSVSDIFDLSAEWINDNANSVDMDIRFKVGATFYGVPPVRPTYATPSIPPGGTFTFQVELQVQGNAPRVLNHTKVTATSRLCTISSTSADMYTYEYNGNLPPATAAQLELSKTASITSAIVGVPFDYVITIVNNSSSTDATGVVISDQVPTNLTINSYGDGVKSGQTIIWDIGTLNKIGGAVNTVQKIINVTPTCASVPSITNKADVLSFPLDNGLGVYSSSVTIPVIDNIAPTAKCTPITVILDATGTANITTAMINNGSYDNCSIQSITISKSSFNCSNLGANTVTLTVTDISGNISTCTSTVTVVDNQVPVFTSCPTTPASLCADNLTTYTKIGTSWDALATDNCSFSLVYNLSGSTTGTGTSLNGVAFNVGTTTVTWTATDTAGNTLNCVFSVAINGLPDITTQPITQLDCEGASVKFKVVASGTGLTYTWQRKKPTDASFITIPVEGNISYPSVGEIKVDNVGSSQSPSGTLYQVVVTTSSGCSVTSSAATLLVNEITGVTPTATTVTQCYGTNYSYTVSTSAPPPGYVGSYKWKNSVASGPWNDVIDGVHFSGATTATLNIINGTPAESAEYRVYVTFHSSGADCNVDSSSRSRTITFLPQITTPVTSVTQPTCTTATGTITVTVQSLTDTYSFDNGFSYQASNSKTGLSTGSYNVIIKNLLGCISPTTNVTLASATKTWNGSAGTDWNTATNWSPNGVPNATNCVIVPDVTNDPIINGTNYNAYAYSLTVLNGGRLIVDKTNTITVTDFVNVNAGGSLTFEDSSSLVQINDVTNSGNITYKRNYTGGEMDYTYWSSPVAAQNLLALSPSTKSDKFFSYSGAINNWFQENPSTTAMTIGKGYIIRGIPPPPPPVVPPGFNTALFTGVPNNGDLSIVVVGGEKSNLIGNPYPSAIDADEFLIDNQDEIKGKISLWTHNTAIQDRNNIPLTAGSGALAYTSDDYAYYNLTGGVGTGTAAISSNNNNNKTVPTGKIAAGQSFFTTSTTAGGMVTFTNAMRIDGSGNAFNNSNFYKTKNPKTKKTTKTIEKHRIWLNLTNTQGAFKQTLLGYISGATNDNDNLYDGESSDDNKFVDFYSLNQNKNLVIQGRALPFDENDEVPLGYRTTINGAFTINIDQTDGLLTNQSVYLEDKLTNTIFNLKSGNYTFNTTPGTFNNRFVLRYTNKTLSIEETEVTDEIIILYSNNYKTLIIRNSDTDTTVNSVTMYNMIGQKIAYWEVKGREQSSIQIPIKNLPSEIYIVKVKTTKGESSKKIIVTNK